MNDSEIREFFHANRPAPLRREEFMAQLEQRILLANEIKREHDKQIAFYRRVSLITLIAGLLIGAGIICKWWYVFGAILGTVAVGVLLFPTRWNHSSL